MRTVTELLATAAQRACIDNLGCIRHGVRAGSAERQYRTQERPERVADDEDGRVVIKKDERAERDGREKTCARLVLARSALIGHHCLVSTIRSAATFTGVNAGMHGQDGDHTQCTSGPKEIDALKALCRLGVDAMVHGYDT